MSNSQDDDGIKFSPGFNLLTVSVAAAVIFLSIAVILSESILACGGCRSIKQMNNEEYRSRAMHSPALALARVARKSHIFLLVGCLATCASLGMVHIMVNEHVLTHNQVLFIFQLLLFLAILNSYKYVIFKYYRYKPQYKCSSCSTEDGLCFFCCFYGNLQLIKRHRDKELVESIKSELSDKLALAYTIDINKVDYLQDRSKSGKLGELVLLWNEKCTSYVQFRIKTGIWVVLLIASLVISALENTIGDNAINGYVLFLQLLVISEIVSLAVMSYNYGGTVFAASLWLIIAAFYPIMGYLMRNVMHDDSDSVTQDTEQFMVNVFIMGFLIVLISIVVILIVVFNNNNLLFKTIKVKDLNLTLIFIMLAFYDLCTSTFILIEYFSGDDLLWGILTFVIMFGSRLIAFYNVNPDIIKDKWTPRFFFSVFLGFGDIVFATKRWTSANTDKLTLKRNYDEKLRFDSNILFCDSIPLMLLQSYAYIVRASEDESTGISGGIFLYITFKFLQTSVNIVKIMYNDFENSDETLKYRKKIKKMKKALSQRRNGLYAVTDDVISKKKFVISKKFLLFYYIFVFSELFCRFAPVIVVLTKLNDFIHRVNGKEIAETSFFALVAGIFVFLFGFEVVSFGYMIEFDVNRASTVHSNIYNEPSRTAQSQEIEIVEDGDRATSPAGLNSNDDLEVAYTSTDNPLALQQLETMDTMNSVGGGEITGAMKARSQSKSEMAAPGGAGHLHDLTNAEVDAVAEMNQIELQEFRFAEIYKEIRQEFKDAKSRMTKYNTTDGMALDIGGQLKSESTTPVRARSISTPSRSGANSIIDTMDSGLSTPTGGVLSDTDTEIYSENDNEIDNQDDGDIKRVETLASAIDEIIKETDRDGDRNGNEHGNETDDKMHSDRPISRSVSNLTKNASGKVEKGVSKAKEKASQAKEKASQAKVKANEKAAIAKEKASQKATQAKVKANEKAIIAKEKASKAKVKATEAKNKVKQKTKMTTQQLTRIICSNMVYIAAGIFSSAIYTFLLNNVGFIFDSIEEEKTLITKKRYVKVHLCRMFVSILFLVQIFVCVFDNTSCSDVGETGVVSVLFIFFVLLMVNLSVGYLFYREKIQRHMYQVPTDCKTVLSRSCCILVLLFGALILVLSAISILAVVA